MSKTKTLTVRSRAHKAQLTVRRLELLVDGSDREFRRLVHGLFAFLALHTSIRDGYAKLLELGGPQYTILLCIGQLAAANPVSVRKIADHLRLSGSFITVETNRLEKLGLVYKKKKDLEDRRMVSLSLTPSGYALLDSIAPLRQKVNDIQFGCLSADEFQRLVPLIYRLIESGERALLLLNFLGENSQSAVSVWNNSSRKAVAS